MTIQLEETPTDPGLATPVGHRITHLRGPMTRQVRAWALSEGGEALWARVLEGVSEPCRARFEQAPGPFEWVDADLSAELSLAWEAEMGGWSRLARVVALDRFSLVVEVDSSPALQELSLRRQELVRRLNRHFEAPFIKHITVRMSQNGA